MRRQQKSKKKGEE
jgi:hypothetical protein